MPERRAIRAGLLYCLVVFGAGFVLGLIRTLWVAPLSGELVAVALEAPVMLAFSWTACGWATERLDVPQGFLDRLVMGGVALGLLIAAEAFTSVAAGVRTLPEYLDEHSRSALLLGLLAQLAFAVFPMVQRHSTGRAWSRSDSIG